MSGPGSINARSQTVQPTPPDFAQYAPDAAAADISFPLGTTTIQFAITDEFRVKPEFRAPPPASPLPKPSIVDSILNALSGW